MSEWQDISTAPSGVQLLVCIVRPNGPTSYFLAIKQTVGGGKFVISDSDWNPKAGNFRVCEPTHWMPLPAPPLTPDLQAQRESFARHNVATGDERLD